MPLRATSRRFLVAALGHLAAAGVLVALGPWTGAVGAGWDALLWLLLIGFVGASTTGFALHLFPAVSRRPLPARPVEAVAFVLFEAGVVLGTVDLLGLLPAGYAGAALSLSAALYLAATASVVARFLTTLRAPHLALLGPEARPADVVTIPLFLSAWVSALAAGVLLLLSGLARGPGFGWWVAGVHLFVLGHAVLLVGAVSLRMVPRSLGADPPRQVALALGALGMAGAVLVPAGMLLLPPGPSVLLPVLAAPEASFAVLLLGTLAYLGGGARTPKRQLVLHISGVMFLVVGGALGLWMVSSGNYDLLSAHAALNVLGFLGLTILLMWFGMVAPFQRLSHAWTRRMLWSLAALWALGTVVLALGSVGAIPSSGRAAAIAGGLLLLVALAWGVGTVPVLYPGRGDTEPAAERRLHT